MEPGGTGIGGEHKCCLIEKGAGLGKQAGGRACSRDV